MTSTLKIAAVQQHCNKDRQTNLDYSISQIAAASQAGAELVVLPELHLDCYFCQTEDAGQFDLAQSIPGPTSELLSAVALRYSVVIVSTIFEKRAPVFIIIPLLF